MGPDVGVYCTFWWTGPNNSLENSQNQNTGLKSGVKKKQKNERTKMDVIFKTSIN